MAPESPGPLGDLLLAAWRQVLDEGRERVEYGGQSPRVGRTSAQGLRTVTLVFGEFTLEGIEQNPRTSSRWAKLAQEGQRIMQFSCRGRYVANLCEGTLLRYPSWKGAGLPP
jgi:hypothetical protein